MKSKVVHILKATGVCGSENHLLMLLPELNKKFSIHVIILVESDKLLSDFKTLLEKKGMIVHRVIIKNHFDISVILKIYLIIKKIKPDICHTHLVHADIYGALASKMAGVPIILSSVHNPDPFRNNLFFKFLNIFVSRFSKRVIAISESLGDFLHHVEQIPKKKISVVKYGLNPQHNLFAEKSVQTEKLRREFNIPEDHIIIGNVARLIPQKGYTFLIDSFYQLANEGFKIILVIVGDGYLKEDLKSKVKELNIDDKVIFTGFRSDAVELMAGFDIFVFPSVWEGFGLVLLEAMSLRKPVIASKVSAIPEIVVNGETGFLIEPRDVLGLKDSIKRLIESPELRKNMGENGWNRMISHFSKEQMVNKTEAIYKELLQNSEI